MEIEKQTYRKNKHVDRKTDVQIEKQTYRQKNRHIDRHIEWQMYRQIGIQIGKCMDRLTYRRTFILTYTDLDRQIKTGNYVEGQTNIYSRQAGRQTDIHTYRQTDRQTHTFRYSAQVNIKFNLNFLQFSKNLIQFYISIELL